jgi:antitoxin component YwqK of YwqJK toxin-antitoxin module
MEGDYVNDKLEGEVVYYNEKGIVVKVEVYDDGVLKETRQGAK